MGGYDNSGKWTCEIMTGILLHVYSDENRDANQGVVKEALVKSDEPENYLREILNQLLCTINDIREYLLLNVVYTFFEYWPQYLLDLHGDVESSETVIAKPEHRKNQINDHLHRTVEVLNQQKQIIRQNKNVDWGPAHFKSRTIYNTGSGITHTNLVLGEGVKAI